MPVDKDTFVTNQKNDYKWPMNKPMTARPSQPPIRTKPNNFYVAKLVVPYCYCDAHLYAPSSDRYKQLADKEKFLYDEITKLNTEMAELAGAILDHPCDTDDEKMETIYQTDYKKRGLNLVKYRKLMPAIESPTGIPVKSEELGLGQGYRDPMMFRYKAIFQPSIDFCPQANFNRTPALTESWFNPITGKTEYQDTVSKMGLSVMKSRQQYTEPLPSTRRRFGDSNVI